MLFVLSTKKQRQQFCNNKKKTHYLLNLRTRRTLFINFNLATFLYISVSYILWSTAGKCWDPAGLDIAFNAPWRRVCYPVTVACQSNGVIIPVSGKILAEKPSLSVIPVVTHIVQFISECFITVLPRPSKTHTLI